MAAEMLFRVDPDCNMARFYKIDVQPTLFGSWALIREWGRIGHSGTVRRTDFQTEDQARCAGSRQQFVKQRRGYVATRIC